MSAAAVGSLIGAAAGLLYLAYGATCALAHVIIHAFGDEPWRKRDALAWVLIWPWLLRTARIEEAERALRQAQGERVRGRNHD